MTPESPSKNDMSLSLVEERATIVKTMVETDRVRVSTFVEEHEEVVRETIQRNEVRVERVPINRIVETAPPVRQEGDAVIYPVLEETLVVEKRLLLKEEIHVISTTRLEPFEQAVTLRAMHADVQRTPTSKAPSQD